MKGYKVWMMMGIVMLVFQLCRPSGTTKVPEDKTIDEHLQEAMFMQRVAIDGMQAIALGRLVAEKAVPLELKNYAQQLVNDDLEINRQLKLLAHSKNVELPSSLSTEEQNRVQQMKQMEDKYFQKLYLKMMIEGRRKDVALFKGAEKAPDPAIVSFATKNLPLLEQHLQKALALQ